MKILKNFFRIQPVIITLLVLSSGVLGYLYYDSYRTNIQNRSLIAETKIENKDLSQDLEIMKGKYDNLKLQVEKLDSKVKKVSYRKHYTKKSRYYSAGRSSRHRYHYSRHKVNYKKLYYQLRSRCYAQRHVKYQRGR